MFTRGIGARSAKSSPEPMTVPAEMSTVRGSINGLEHQLLAGYLRLIYLSPMAMRQKPMPAAISFTSLLFGMHCSPLNRT